MDRPTFVEFLEKQFDTIRELNNTKGVEYSGHEDVLSDFREVSSAVGVTQEQALLTYMTKHWRAINSWAQTGSVLSEPIAGRVQDLVLYGLLLLAMIEDGVEAESRTTAVTADYSVPVVRTGPCTCDHARNLHRPVGHGVFSGECTMPKCSCDCYEEA